jgi:hypothetical protein
MDRRKFVKALAALPAASVGLAAGVANIASRSGPAETARSVAPVAAGRLPDLDPETFDRFLRETVHLRILDGHDEPFDQFLGLLDQPPGYSIPVGDLGVDGFPLSVRCEVDGREIVGTVENFELDFRRDLTVAEFDIDEARVSQPGFCEMEVSIRVDDQFSVKLQEIADEFKRVADEMTMSFGEMERRIANGGSILPDLPDCRCRSYHRRTGLHVADCPLSDDASSVGFLDRVSAAANLPKRVLRTSEPAKLAPKMWRDY